MLPSIMGWSEINSLMLQVPAMVTSSSGVVMSAATAQASMSNMPPATGVPSGRPVSLAASALILPHRS